MSVRSRSSASFTSSRAEYSALGSMRMSSGASTAYEKPRSGRSSCIDETPRSRSTTSARTPFAASCSSVAENSPCRSRAFTPVPRRKRSKNGATVGSRSIAISFPEPCRRAARSDEWPPAPNVASTTVSPGRGARAATTSSARTGTWSDSVGKTLGNIFRAPFDLVQPLTPLGSIPDLEVVVDARHGHLAPEPGVLDQRRRQDEPALTVELALRRAGEEVAPHRARVLAERVECGDAGGQALPLGARVGEGTPVQPARHDDPVRERRPELRRERETVLVVEGVLMFTQQHGPLIPTLTHSFPLVNPGAPPPVPARRGAPFPVQCRACPRASSRPPRSSSPSACSSPAAAARRTTRPSAARSTTG